MDLLILISVIGTVGSIATFISKLIVLIWVFYQSKRIAAIAYLGFLVFDLFIFRWLSGLLFNNLKTVTSLGELVGEKMANFLFLQSFIPSIVEPILFIWLLVSLTRKNNPLR